MDTKALESVACMFSGARQSVEKHGHAIWGTLCDEFWTDVPFTLEQAVDRLAPQFGLARSTMRQYIRATLRYVEAEERDGEPCPVRRVSGKAWMLPSR
jgi:hypothetical protein